MKIKHQLAIFNAITRLVIVVVLWFSLPILIENVVYNHINDSLLEKKQKFISKLNNEEIKDFRNRNDPTETFASFSTMHNEFLQLYRAKSTFSNFKTFFTNESRTIENEENKYRILYYNFKYGKTNYILEIGNNISEIEDLTFSIRLFIVVLIGLTVFFTFLLDTFFVEYLLKPFYQIINKKIKFVNTPESFDFTPIASHSKDFQELDEVINEMMLRVQEHFKNEKQFIANVSHELLTPIAVLKNRFENLIQNDSLNEIAIDKISSSLKTLDLLKKIINNLLLISKIEKNQYDANESINFSNLFNILLGELEDRIDEKNINVEKNIIHNYYFKGNSTLLHILFFNIVVNAIKFNPINGKLIIKDGYSNQNYFISISDSGPGISTAQVSEIFNRFTKINISNEGQGLGLAIAKTIAKFHQLKIDVSSSKRGSIFKIEFPLS
ncbi:MAG: HAMP domain-containing histidine kinase [Flavobacterium sp.]|nr:HAMP domain-containing histidine kinase [Flavobacterium sp.]